MQIGEPERIIEVPEPESVPIATPVENPDREPVSVP